MNVDGEVQYYIFLDEFEAEGPHEYGNVPAGFEAPFDHVPEPCEGGDAAFWLEEVQALVDDISDALTFLAYIERKQQDACAEAHLDAIDDLMTQIEDT